MTTSNADLSWVANYIWGIADDVLRDLYVRGKYRDVILPMTVLRRLDAVLEDTRQAVLGMKAVLDKAGVVEQKNALRAAAGQAFYWKVTVERPLRIEGADPNRVYRPAEIKELKTGERSGDAPPVIRKIHEPGPEADPLRGLFAATVNGRPTVVEYEPDTDLRDTEQVPLQEEGGIEAFLRREVLPYAADAWYRPDGVKIGYEISFTRYFYKPKPMRTLAEIRADILALESETEGLLAEILGHAEPASTR